MSPKSKNVDMESWERWNPAKPYNSLPDLPPPLELETKAVLKRCVTARAALAALQQAAALIPNPGMLVNTLPLLEAQASSEIENIVTTADALFRNLHRGERADPATREALRYREALLESYRERGRRPLGTRSAESICTRIKGVDMTVRRTPGTALVNLATGETIYTPPTGEARLRELLANWETFLHGEDTLDPLVRMAVAHYQFEAIHPFTDGNGRTGRVLNTLVLVERGVLDVPILFLSRYIVRRKADYYRLLGGVTRQDAWEPWLLYLLQGVEETALWTTARIDAIRRLADHTADYLRAKVPKIFRRELVDVVFEQPYCRIGNLVAAGIVGRQAASRYLQSLVAIGVLKEHRSGRDKLFLHPKLLALLTEEANTFVPYE